MWIISHSSKDKNLSDLTSELLAKAFNLPSGHIRCTSVTRNSLEAGSNFNEELKKEFLEAELILALLTPGTLASNYVLMELGLCWGASKTPILACARGASPRCLRNSPQSSSTAPYLSGIPEVCKLLEDIGKKT